DILIIGSSADFDTIVELLAKLILKPAFDQKELDSFKAERVEQILSQKAAAGQTAKDAAMRLLFGKYPFGHPVGGTADSIGKITRDDLVLYHDRSYIPNNAELLVEGDVSAEDVTRIARSQLGVWGKGGVVPPNFVPPASLTGNKIVVLDSAASTGTAVLAQIGVSRRAEDYFADLIVAKLIASAAGKLGSTLGAQYTSSLEARYLPGPLVVQVDAPIGNLLPATQAVVSAMINLIQGGASEEDVNRIKGEIIAAFASSGNTDAGRGDLLLEIEQYGLGRDYSINFADRLNAVSIEEITAAAGKHLKPGALAIAVVGPASQLQTAFAKLGQVSVAK
ncbi:MAG: M16 family metallopeptidase, partial [Blastocatellia bacterium]